MTASILALEDVATFAYSAKRLARMDRANRITRLMFNARRKGGNLTALEAAELVDAEIDQPNLPTVDTKPVTATKPTITSVPAFIIAANQPAANEPNIQTSVVTRIIATTRQALTSGLTIAIQWLNKQGVTL